MSGRIKTEDISSAIMKVLTEYGKECDEAIDKEAKSSMKELVAATKRDAPVNPNSKGTHYRDQISSKTLKSGPHAKSYLWYVKGDKYRLAHLLNNGHALRNGGRVPGDNHVTKNATRILGEYANKVEEAISKHGS